MGCSSPLLPVVGASETFELEKENQCEQYEIAIASGANVYHGFLLKVKQR